MASEGVDGGQEGLFLPGLLRNGLKKQVVGLAVGEASGFAPQVVRAARHHSVKAQTAQVVRKEPVSGLGIDHDRIVASALQDALERDQGIPVIVVELMAGEELADQGAVGGIGMVVIAGKTDGGTHETGRFGHDLPFVQDHMGREAFRENKDDIGLFRQALRLFPEAGDRVPVKTACLVLMGLFCHGGPPSVDSKGPDQVGKTEKGRAGRAQGHKGQDLAEEGQGQDDETACHRHGNFPYRKDRKDQDRQNGRHILAHLAQKVLPGIQVGQHDQGGIASAEAKDQDLGIEKEHDQGADDPYGDGELYERKVRQDKDDGQFQKGLEGITLFFKGRHGGQGKGS